MTFSRLCWLGVIAIVLGQFDLFGEADLGEQPDAVEVGVNLIPAEAVARGDGMGVVVVVPALAAADQGDPPVVARVVAGFKAARAPEMRGRVDEPGSVQTERHAQEGSP